LASNFKDDSSVYRSNVLVSGGKMNFGGWTSVVDYDHSTPVQIINQAWDLPTNGGRKLIALSNGWLICCIRNSTTALKYYKSTDNGATWTLLGNQSYDIYCWHIANIGTVIYTIYALNSNGNITFTRFDATQGVGGELSGLASYATSTVATGQTAIPTGVSFAFDSTNAIHVAWDDVIATYTNSKNIIYSKSTDNGATWAAATQITTTNTTGQDNSCPNVVIKSDKPILIFRYGKTTATTSYIIKSIRYTTSWQAAVNVFDGGTYAQGIPSAVVSADGSIHVCWAGKDATDTTAQNIRYNKSTDDSATWGTASKLTSGNTYDQSTNQITTDGANKIFVIWGGTVSDSWYQIRKIVYSGGSWGSISNLTTGNSNKTELAVCANFTSFTDPLVAYKSTQDVQMMYRGILQATGQAALTSNIARYNILPPTGTSTEIVSWIQHERATPDSDFVVTAYESIVDTSANESYTAMTKTTSNLSASSAEEQFLMIPVTAQEKVTLKIIMTRATTSVSKAITKILGAVG
jgi:hypothetical protein